MGIEILPPGYSELVALSVEYWDWDNLPGSDEEVWDSLMSQIFLGSTVRSAQAKYVKEVLDPFISYDVAWEVDTEGWSGRLLERIREEKARISNTPGAGYKMAILNLVEQDIANFKVSRTVFDALKFFDNYGICMNEVLRIENDLRETENLVDLARREIFNVSYVKAVLWLYGCGIARELVPPNAHVLNFLRQHGYLGHAWEGYDRPPDWQIFSVVRDRIQEVARQVSSELGEQITPKQAQAAVWYLQTCKGLLSSRYSGQLSPRRLMGFLEYQGWKISDLEEAILDVEQLDDLAEDLKSCIRTT